MNALALSRVRAGAAVLDAHFGGADWRELVDLETLDLRDCENCVLGQLFGEYSDGCTALDVAADPYELGFDRDVYNPDTSVTCADLEAAWREVIAPA